MKFKKLLPFLIAAALIAAIAISAAAGLRVRSGDSIPADDELLEYTLVNAVLRNPDGSCSVTGASVAPSDSAGKQTVHLEIRIESEEYEYAEMSGNPVVSTDPELEHTLRLTDICYDTVMDGREPLYNTLTIDAETDTAPEIIYVYIPPMNRTTDDVLTIEGMSGSLLSLPELEEQSETDKDDLPETTQLLLTASSDEFSVIPRLATLISGEDSIPCDFVDMQTDNASGETVIVYSFTVPGDYKLPESFDLLVEGTLEPIEIPVLEIELQYE